MPAGMDAEAALAYAERHTLHALVIEVAGAMAFERYANGYDETKPEVVEESAADVPAATDWAAWFREMWAAGFTGGGS